MMNFDAVMSVKEGNKERLLSYKGVHAVGVGYQDKASDEPSVLVYVDSQENAEKLMKAENSLFTSNAAPFHIVIEPPVTYDILRLPDDGSFPDEAAVNKDIGRYRPLLGGIQLHLRQGTSSWAGTLGTFVKLNDTSDSDLYLLSNKHVLESVGLAVYQPLNGSGNVIGAVTTATEFPDIDAALALVNNLEDAAINTIQDIGIVKEIRRLTTADVRKRVIKRGRTTALTEGTIESIGTDITVSGKVKKDCVIVRSDNGKLFSDAGDSGSPVVLRDEYKLTGLLFGANKIPGGITVFCRIDNVFDHLNIRLPD